MKAYEVFNPNGFPNFTYVERLLLDEAGNEYAPQSQLNDDIQIPGRIISLAGPSKSGKTVLIEKVVGAKNLIKISGAEINERDLWDLVLDAIGAPEHEKGQKTNKSSQTTEGINAFEFGVPNIAKNTSTIRAGNTTETSNQIEYLNRRNSYSEIAKTVLSSKVLLIDDFHYITQEKQKVIAKQIKHISEDYKGKICVAQVIHKGESIIRSNPDLSGRVSNIDFKYWQIKDLIEIAHGFELLGIQINDAAIKAFADESAGSPQLMQLICLNACNFIGVTEKLDTPKKFNLDLDQINKIISTAIRHVQRKVIYTILSKGPDERGNPRSIFKAYDGNSSDIYQGILLSIALDPPKLAISRDELLKRIYKIIGNNSLPASTITRSVKQHLISLQTKHNDSQPEEARIDYFDWDDESGLHIEDPYFLFYCRWQPRAVTMRTLVGRSYE